MVFTLLIAADVHGSKLNYEVPFTAAPSLEELRHRTERIFIPEFAQRRPPLVPQYAAFCIDMFQVFDERIEAWVDLVSSSQLHDAAQVYAFQPESEWHREVQTKLPAAVPLPVPSAPSPRPAGGSSPYARTGSPYGAGGSPRLLHPAATAGLPPTVLPPPPPPPPPAVLPPTAFPPPPAPVHPGPGAVLLAGAAVDAPHHAKVSLVFEQLDARRTGVVTPEDWQQVFARLRFNFDPAVVGDLFRKADTDLDGVVTLPEFQRFAEMYPTVLDAMHFRTREWWIDQRQREGIDTARRLCDSLRNRVLEARQALEQAAADTRRQEAEVAAQDLVIAEAEQRERDVRAMTDLAARDTERVRSECGERVQVLASARDEERQRMGALGEAQRECEAAQLRTRAQEAVAARAEERLREIQRLLQEQQQEADAQRHAAARAHAESAAAQEREAAVAQLVADAQRRAQGASDSLAAGEAELARAQERERDTGLMRAAAREEVARQRAHKEQRERDAAVVRAREEQMRQAESEALRAVDAQDKMCQALEAENAEHNAQRMRMEDEEKNLLHQEVSLRVQRETLEHREAELRNASGDFSVRTKGRGAVPASALLSGISPQRDLGHSPQGLHYRHGLHPPL